MPSHRLIFLALLILAIASGCAFPSTRVSDPIYAGVRLSEWLNRLPSDPWSSRENTNEAVRAVRSIGENALPYLLKTISTTNSPSECCDAHGRGNATLGFATLGLKALPTLPELGRLLQNPNLVADVAPALTFLGPAGYKVLATGLTNADFTIQWSSAGNLKFWLDSTNNPPGTRQRYQKEAKVAVPALVIALRDTNPQVKYAAVVALGDIQQEPELVVPALKAIVADPTVSESLRKLTKRILARFGVSASDESTGAK